MKLQKAPNFELVEDDGKLRTPKEAEAYWKARGYEIALLKHFYALADSLTLEWLDSIRKDCRMRMRWIVCGRLNYQGEMVSVNGGGFINCPVYNGIFLVDVLGTPEGLNLFHALCGTEDDAETIMLKLENLSGVGRECFMFWTPTMDSRKAYPSRAAWFDYYVDGFHLDGGSNIGNFGRSFGVRVRER